MMSHFEGSLPHSQRDPSSCHQALVLATGLRLACHGSSHREGEREHSEGTSTRQGSGLDVRPSRVAGALVTAVSSVPSVWGRDYSLLVRSLSLYQYRQGLAAEALLGEGVVVSFPISLQVTCPPSFLHQPGV